MKSLIPHSKGLAALSASHRAVHSSSHAPYGSFATLTIGALGIVYGDIGTSPLYAMDQLFLGRAGGAETPADVLGGVSLVIWTITLIVAVKYAILVLRAHPIRRGSSSLVGTRLRTAALEASVSRRRSTS